MQQGGDPLKRMLTCLFCVLLLLSLTACRSQETIELTEFLARWNDTEAQKLAIEDFFLEEDTAFRRRFAVLNHGLLLRVIATTQEQTAEVRLILPKANADGTPKAPTADAVASFDQYAVAMLCAFCDLPDAKAKRIAQSFGLHDPSLPLRQGEQTAELFPFHLTWRSNALECVFVIDNTRLVEIASTEKPERKQPFDATTATRTDTVPHK